MRNPADVPELKKYPTAIFMYCVNNATPRSNLLRRMNSRSVDVALPHGGNLRRLGDNQSGGRPLREHGTASSLGTPSTLARFRVSGAMKTRFLRTSGPNGTDSKRLLMLALLFITAAKTRYHSARRFCVSICKTIRSLHARLCLGIGGLAAH